MLEIKFCEIKESFNECISRLDIEEERINELKDMSIESL